VLIHACVVDDRVLSTQRPIRPPSVLKDAALADAQRADGQADTDAHSPTLPSVEAGAGGTMNDEDAAQPEPDASEPSPIPNECDRPEQQLQIANAAFDRNDLDWAPYNQASKDWSEDDSSGNPESGSLVVRNDEVEPGMGLSSAGVSQCLEIPRDAGYQVCVDYLLGNEGSVIAGAMVKVTLFDGEGCSGSISTSPSIPVQRDKGGWTTFRAHVAAPPPNSSFKSMLLMLATVKSVEDQPLDVQFDNVRIGTTP
jgi:hypothetical protein